MLFDELLDAMKAAKLTRAALAKRVATSRTGLYRLLDPDNTGVMLATIARTLGALGIDFEVARLRFAPAAPAGVHDLGEERRQRELEKDIARAVIV